MSIVSLSVPDGWKVLQLNTIGQRLRVDLGRNDHDREVLLTVEEYPEYIQDRVTEAIDEYAD